MNDLFFERSNVLSLFTFIKKTLDENKVDDVSETNLKNLLYKTMTNVFNKLDLSRINIEKKNLYIKQLNEKTVKLVLTNIKSHHYSNQIKNRDESKRIETNTTSNTFQYEDENDYNLEDQFGSDHKLEEIVKEYERMEGSNNSMSFDEKLKKMQSEREFDFSNNDNNLNSSTFETERNTFNIAKPIDFPSFQRNDVHYNSSTKFEPKFDSSTKFEPKFDSSTKFEPNKTKSNNNEIQKVLDNYLLSESDLFVFKNKFKDQENQLCSIINTSTITLNKIKDAFYDSIVEKRYIVDSKHFENSLSSEYLVDLPKIKTQKIYFVHMNIHSYPPYNVYDSVLETNTSSSIPLSKGKYSPDELLEIFEKYGLTNISFDKNKFNFDTQDVVFKENHISKKLGLLNGVSSDFSDFCYIDFYINDVFVEKINTNRFSPFKVEFELSIELSNLKFSFCEEGTKTLFRFSTPHIVEFICQN